MRQALTQLVAAAVMVTGTAAALGKDDPLAAYAGKYPFDAVGGVTFLAQPVVVAGVRKAVTDKTVLGWVLNTDVTAGPIVIAGGKIEAWACEPHNCGDHQWTIVIDVASGATDVCYRDGPAMKDGEARWYLASGVSELRPGDCPSD